MQITRKELKTIISEEMETVTSEKDELESLLESYVADYDSDEQTVSKDALIDFLEALEESRIPLTALQLFMENMPDQAVTSLLKEVVETETDEQE